MVLRYQILFSLAIAALAVAILRGTSAKQVPFLHRIAPRYLKLVTYSNFWPLVLISAQMLFLLLVMILLFYVHSKRRCSVGEVLKFIIAGAPP